jgi:hypothetical protein
MPSFRPTLLPNTPAALHDLYSTVTNLHLAPKWLRHGHLAPAPAQTIFCAFSAHRAGALRAPVRLCRRRKLTQSVLRRYLCYLLAAKLKKC